MIVRPGSSAQPLMARSIVSVSRSRRNRFSMGAVQVLMTTLVTTLAATLATAATPDVASSRALPTGGHAGSLFVPAWDADGDGKVSRAEYDAARTQRFASADEDGDGALSADEYVNEYAQRLDHQIADERKASMAQTDTRFRALDRDTDNFITRVEYDASGERSFAQLDHDKDGRIAKSDPEAVRTFTEANDTERAKRSSQPQPQRQRSVISMPSTHSRAGFMEIYDGDADGVVTREQYDAQRRSAFTATDANADGKIDRNEYVDEFADRLDRQIARSRQAQLKQGHVRFEAIDSDKNGSIGRDEYLTMSARMFERADTDKDGIVSQDEPPVREGDNRSP